MLSTGRDVGGLGQAVVQFIYLSIQDLLGENKNYIITTVSLMDDWLKKMWDVYIYIYL